MSREPRDLATPDKVDEGQSDYEEEDCIPDGTLNASDCNPAPQEFPISIIAHVSSRVIPIAMFIPKAGGEFVHERPLDGATAHHASNAGTAGGGWEGMSMYPVIVFPMDLFSSSVRSMLSSCATDRRCQETKA